MVPMIAAMVEIKRNSRHHHGKLSRCGDRDDARPHAHQHATGVDRGHAPNQHRRNAWHPGATVAGTQAIGVSTPSAAAVALATVGLARLAHKPKGWMFAIRIWSMM